ncbi:MAG: hypothetical protein IKS69_04185 [Erysipelotrichaceae bacterium]|nr:hypothetical protein [Erysipelotrichaceae bacterium]
MSLEGKTIKSRASGMSGTITGIDEEGLRISFTKPQEITVPFQKAEDLLILDDETLKELKSLIRKHKHDPAEKTSKVPTYMDDDEVEIEEDQEEELPLDYDDDKDDDSEDQ